MVPGIVKVGYFEASLLPDFTKPVAPVRAQIVPEWVELSDVGSLSEDADYDPLGLAVKTTLEFSSPDEIPVNRQIAFLVEDALENRYIVGNRPPHCGVLKRQAQINSPSEKASVNYYSFNIPIPKHAL